jgi:hypothetical protein
MESVAAWATVITLALAVITFFVRPAPLSVLGLRATLAVISVGKVFADQPF